MKLKNLMAVAAGGLLLVACNETTTNNKVVALNNGIDSLSYALGVDIGKNLAASEVTDINGEALAKAISDHKNNTTVITPEEASQVIRDFFDKKSKEKSAGAQAEGEAFLAENSKNPDVKITESGLQYIVLNEGTGAKPMATDRVVVHYHGTLIDGTVFDSSVDRGEPASFPVNGVIPGWVEALQLMPVGSKYKLFIPSYLAYGDRGAGQQIGPGSTLIFEVELLEIMDANK